MSNVIALIWDCDKTLVDGYMQDPIFRHYGVDAGQFWAHVQSLPAHYRETQDVKVNPETVYLNEFIRCAHNGTFPGLNNEMLRSFGAQQRFYPGVPDILRRTRALVNDNAEYAAFGIRLEHYIVSTGFAEVIRGSAVMDEVAGVWGCELIEAPDAEGRPVLSEIGYTIDNTTKTRALFEINKGIPFIPGIDVNSSVPEENRRVPFRNMIYIADGPSDSPAFSLVNRSGGATFAIYPHGDGAALAQVERMRQAGRVNMYAEADYTEGTTAVLWLTAKIRELAERILREEKQKITSRAGASPRHLA